MHSFTETRVLPFTPQQLFAIVIDIEKYPEFLPWCRAARIVSREKDSFLGELIISFSHITERYTSRVTPTPPPLLRHSRACPENPTAGMDTRNKSEDDDAVECYGEGHIEVDLVSGPFRYLRNYWRFVPHAEGTELHFLVDFEFKSKLLNSLIGGMFTRASEKMVSAFLARAQALYGS